MKFLNELKGMDNKYSFSFLGFLVGILGFAFAIYMGFYYKSSPELVFNITNNTDVISMREDLNDLIISYNDDVIDNKKASLKLLTFSVSNVGNRDIVIGDYDPSLPFGFEILNGHVVENPILTNASNDYLKEHITITKLDSSFIFPNIIIESGESFGIKVLLVSENGEIPSLHPIGKIAGVKEMIISNELQKESDSLLSNAFKGNLLTQVIRLVIYFVVMLLFIGIVALSASSISDQNVKRKKNKVIKKFKKSKRFKENEYNETIISLYREHNIDDLERVFVYIKDEDKLNKVMEEVKKFGKNSNGRLFHNSRIEFEDARRAELEGIAHPYFRMRSDFRIISTLVESDLIVSKNDSYSAETKFTKQFERFMDFIAFVH